MLQFSQTPAFFSLGGQFSKSSRRLLAPARRYSVAADVFFVCETKRAKERADGIRMRLNTRCLHQGGIWLGHRDISIWRNELPAKGAAWIKRAIAAQAALLRRDRQVKGRSVGPSLPPPFRGIPLPVSSIQGIFWVPR